MPLASGAVIESPIQKVVVQGILMHVQDAGAASVAEMSFGRWLQHRRKALDLTQADLGRRAGCAAVTIHKLETDQLRPSREMAERLAEELGITEKERLEFLRRARGTGQPKETAQPRRPPVPLTSFIGRERELEEVQRLLKRSRLLTLTGTGGVGKTRLALEVVRLLAGKENTQAVVVELPIAIGPSGVAAAVASGLGLVEQPDRPLRTSILDFLRNQRLLLVLDNCEHVVGPVADLVQSVLSVCEGVQILATSRERLGLLGETTWRVPSMALPSEDMAAEVQQECDAFRLFVERACALMPDFVVTERTSEGVVRICKQLDGIPLALELAAARIGALSVQQIAERLHDSVRLLNSGNRTAPPRHQTLEATFEWSCQLLLEPERTLLARLAVFTGGWTLEAAEGVCADQLVPAMDVMDLLLQLTEKSLVVAEQLDDGSIRYRLHEPLRQFLMPRFAANAEAIKVRTQHAHWFMTLASQATERYHGPSQAIELDRIEREHANITGALHWLDQQEDMDRLDRLGIALWWFWMRRGHLQEGRAWLERLIARSAPARPSLRRSALLMQLASIAWLQGDFAEAQMWNEESLALAREHADIGATAYALGLAGRLAVVRGDFAGGRAAFEESLQLTRTLADSWWEGRVREGLATVALQQGDFSGAALQLEQAIGLARRTGDDWSLATLLNGLGDISRARGSYEQAGQLYRESEALHRTLGTEPAPTLRHNLAYVALHTGELDNAQQLFVDALRLYQSYSEQRGMAECLVGLAGVAAASGERSRAATLLGAAEAGFESVGAEISPSNRGDFSRVVAAARAGCSPSEFKTAWSHGYALGTQGIVAEVLAAGSDRPRISESPRGTGPLSQREAQVAALVARGHSNREIATALIISEATVERHIANIFRKLEVRSRAQVAAWVTRQGLLQPSD